MMKPLLCFSNKKLTLNTIFSSQVYSFSVIIFLIKFWAKYYLVRIASFLRHRKNGFSVPLDNNTTQGQHTRSNSKLKEVNMNRVSKEQIARIGVGIGWGLVLMGIFISLGKYIIPSSWYTTIMTPLYGAEYVNDHMPKSADRTLEDFSHRVVGVLYLVIGMLQFSKKFQTRFRKLHKYLGRVWVLVTIVLGLTGISIAIFVPFGGIGELIATVIFAGYMVFAVIMGWRTAIQKKFKLHRDWMFRAVMIGFGFSTIRFAFMAINFLSPSTPDRDILTVCFWIGWGLQAVVAEWWIYYSARNTAKGGITPRTLEQQDEDSKPMAA
ncbi:MAG TPA: hypothetical protein DCE41_08170 [Cytophagales bacterium]|nr:hypothetical protein [Cytophagales bacterium]HAA18541.1 hypothetical protein [Cytophagales bacterium]HAP62936.1 hypothetical protein [Cytophagales bacterium]